MILAQTPAQKVHWCTLLNQWGPKYQDNKFRSSWPRILAKPLSLEYWLPLILGMFYIWISHRLHEEVSPVLGLLETDIHSKDQFSESSCKNWKTFFRENSVTCKNSVCFFYFLFLAVNVSWYALRLSHKLFLLVLSRYICECVEQKNVKLVCARQYKVLQYTQVPYFLQQIYRFFGQKILLHKKRVPNFGLC